MALPVVMMSASPEANAVNPKDPAVWFLAKPFHVDDVLGLIKRLIGN